MRAVTQAAMVDAVRQFMLLWDASRATTEAEWGIVGASMAQAAALHVEDIERAAGGRFDGAYYNPARDDRRLQCQLGRIFSCMEDGQWHTLAELGAMTYDPQPSISAQLRHLRKTRHGSWIVDSTHRGGGLYAYRLRNPDGTLVPPVLPMAYQPPHDSLENPGE